ncbi:MAG: response regulator transcription factor [Chloroflexi bacterium]|nr:response regulator transcription factor [Chloroflexota bacterium]
MKPIRTLLVDDSREFLESIKQFLVGQHWLEIVGEAHSGGEALALVAALRPDLALIDLRMPGLNGLEAARCLKARPNSPRIIITTLYDNPEYRAAALAACADGFIAKSELGAQLLTLVERLFSGQEQSEKAMFPENEQHDCETALLKDMSGELRACRSSGEAGAIIAHFARQLFPTVPGALYMRRADDGFFELAASWGGFPATTGDGAFSAYECWALRRGYAHTNSRPGCACEHISRGEAHQPDQSQRYLCLPFATFQGDVLGLLHFRCPLQAGSSMSRKPTPSTLRLAMIMTDYIASALAM